MSVLRVHIRKALTVYNDLTAVRHLVDISGVRGRFKHTCWGWGNSSHSIQPIHYWISQCSVEWNENVGNKAVDFILQGSNM